MDGRRQEARLLSIEEELCYTEHEAIRQGFTAVSPSGCTERFLTFQSSPLAHLPYPTLDVPSPPLITLFAFSQDAWVTKPTLLTFTLIAATCPLHPLPIVTISLPTWVDRVWKISCIGACRKSAYTTLATRPLPAVVQRSSMHNCGLRLALPTAFLDDDDEGKARSSCSDKYSSRGLGGATMICGQQGWSNGQQQALWSGAGGGGMESDLVLLGRRLPQF